jgi:hypothetical protein
MTDQEKLKTVQLFYAGLMVDAASNFEHFRIAGEVAAKKAAEQRAAAPVQLSQLGVHAPRELFERFAELFGCVRWEVQEGDAGGVVAESRSCLACAMAKKRGSGRPCSLYCVNPFKAFAAEMGFALEVGETLWEGERCLFRMARP